jgi:hypothetical protein
MLPCQMCDVKDQSCIPCYLQPLLSFLSNVHPYLVSFSVYFYASPAPGNYLVLSMPTLHPTHHPRKKGGGERSRPVPRFPLDFVGERSSWSRLSDPPERCGGSMSHVV